MKWTPEFRALIVGRAAATLGNAAAPVALSFAMIDTGAGAAALGVILCAFFGPQILLTLLSGVLADRLKKRRLLVWASLLGGSSQTLLALVLHRGSPAFAQVLLLTIASGTASAMAAPAMQSLIRGLVRDEQLQRAHSYVRLAQNVARAAGPAVAGVLTGVLGAAAAVALDGACRFAAAASLGRATKSLPVLEERREAWTASLRSGLAYYRSQPWLVVIVLSFMLANAVWVGAIQILGPLRVENLFAGARDWGILMSAMFVGGLASTGALASAKNLPHPLLVACAATALKALAPAALAMGDLRLAVVGFLLAGAGTEIFSVLYGAEVHRRVPESILGRVMSIDIFFGVVLLPLGYLTAPLWDQYLGVRGVFNGAAILFAAGAGVTIVTLLATGELKNPAPEGSSVR